MIVFQQVSENFKETYEGKTNRNLSISVQSLEARPARFAVEIELSFLNHIERFSNFPRQFQNNKQVQVLFGSWKSISLIFFRIQSELFQCDMNFEVNYLTTLYLLELNKTNIA